MELFHYLARSGNFGDDLNTWFWDAFLPGWREAMPGTMLIGIGTLINNDLPRGMPKLVIGSGVGYGALPDAELMAECRFLAVRGPRSARALGLPPETGIIDPAALLPEHPDFRDIPRTGRPVFVPHMASVRRQDWARLCPKAGVDYVSPEADAHSVIRRIAGAPLVIAESMHAAIIADAFGTPWHGVSVSHRFNGSKWLDWSDSVGVDPGIRPLYPAIDGTIRRLLGKPHPASRRTDDMTGGAATREAAKAKPSPARYSWRSRVRHRLEAQMTPAAMRRFATEPGQLSDRARLEAARDRYRAVLQQVREEFSAIRREAAGRA